MLLFGDYHTHTKYSHNHHGKNTVLENAVCAKSKGLKQIAITDHGYGHLFYGVKRRKVSKLLADIEEAKKITNMDVLHGIEANFTSLDGTIDVTDEEYEKLDVLVVGHHRFTKAKTIKDFFQLFLANMFGGKKGAKRIQRNTQTVLNAMNKYPIDILSHLGYGMPVDIEPIALLAVEKNIYIELNGKKCDFTKEEMQFMINAGVKFIVNSDAHRAIRVGEVHGPINYVIKYKIPSEQLVNLDKLPKFKKERK